MANHEVEQVCNFCLNTGQIIDPHYQGQSCIHCSRGLHIKFWDGLPNPTSKEYRDFLERLGKVSVGIRARKLGAFAP